MVTSRSAIAALFCFSLWIGAVSKGSAQDLPKGRTGLPIGSYLTIEGVRDDSKHYNFKVDTVNGKKLDRPLFLSVEDSRLASNGRQVLKGYETIQMIGTPPAFHEAEREAGIPTSEGNGTDLRPMASKTGELGDAGAFPQRLPSQILARRALSQCHSVLS